MTLAVATLLRRPFLSLAARRVMEKVYRFVDDVIEGRRNDFLRHSR